jgi:diguanylate cyclase (GGDEF)-like protein
MAGKSNEKQLKALSAINRIHGHIGENLGLEEISRIVVEELCNAVSCTACAIVLIEGEKIRILSLKGFSKMLAEGELLADLPVIKYVANKKEAICTGDIANHHVIGSVSGACFAKSLICTPILINNQTRGIIELDSPDQNAFDEQDYGLVELMAKEMSIAMQHSFMQAQVKLLTVKDDVTGCLNRKQFDEDLETEIARAKRYHRPLAFLMIVVDWFKRYTDFHGLKKGDELLKQLADLFRANVRGVDTVYRYGGEEFIILLPETTEKNAHHVAKRIKRIMEQIYFEGERQSQPNKKITLSMEVAGYPWDGEGKEELLKSIAFAFYRAKQSGKDRSNVTEKVKSAKRAIRNLF